MIDFLKVSIPCFFAYTMLFSSCSHHADQPVTQVLSSNPFSFHFPDAVNNLALQSPKYIKASDGIDLAYYDFVPAQPNTIMVFYHGGGAWSMGLYQYMAQQLELKHDVGTYLFDIRGHGNSQGPRGDAPSTEQVWQDISSALDFVQQKHPTCKIILGGHSSGAGLVLNYTGWQKHKAVSAYVFLAPYLGSQSGTARHHSDPAKRFVKEIHFFPLVLNFMSNGYFFAHKPVIFFNYPKEEKQKDPHLLDYYTCAMAQATTPNNPQTLFAKLDKPFLLFIGEHDEQFIPERVIAFHQHALLVKDNSLSQIIPDATHLSIVIQAPALIEKGLNKILLVP